MRRQPAMGMLRRVGRFWYDFLVGDRWELFVGPLVVLALTAGLVAVGAGAVLTGLALFVGVALIAALSVASQSG